ncbi:MAG: hypothetical protein Q9164_002961 [Protoblastenia rupestris]
MSITPNDISGPFNSKGHVIGHPVGSAVRHRDMRRYLLDRASQNGVLQYTHEQAHGTDPDDTKGFVPKDQDYASDWAHRPPLLFAWDDNDNDTGASPHNARRPTECMKIGSQIVIDDNDHEICLFPDLPDVLSTQIEGADIEYYKRQHKTLNYYDLIELLARTPPGSIDSKRLSMRASRFRWKAGLKSWKPRDGSQGLVTELAKLVVPVGNSIQGFGRDLTDSEIEALKVPNKGRFPSRRRKEKREADARGGESTGQPQESKEPIDKRLKSERVNTSSPSPKKEQERRTLSFVASKERLSDDSDCATSIDEFDEYAPKSKKQKTRDSTSEITPTAIQAHAALSANFNTTRRIQCTEGIDNAGLTTSGPRPITSRRKTWKAHDTDKENGPRINDDDKSNNLGEGGSIPPHKSTPPRGTNTQISSKPDPIPTTATASSNGQQTALLPNNNPLAAEDHGIWTPRWKRMNSPNPITDTERAILNRIPLTAPSCAGYQVVNGYWTDPDRVEEAKRASITVDQVDGAFFRSLRHVLRRDSKWP